MPKNPTPTEPVCPYCGHASRQVNGKIIYPHRPDLYDKWFYQCAPCEAYVGCHPGTERPLGRLANVELRQAKIAAHAAFDPLWQSRHAHRRDAYAWLAEQLGIAVKHCHIGQFDIDQCRRVVVVCTSVTIERGI
ncbi:MAG: hypothetical protein IPL99_12380 [Candidatus Competibacteraceae bacterium]|nr:hypothetical protein [Candidatus Competibacteraceae bacterium]